MKPHYLHEVMGAEEADTTELERSLEEAIAEVAAASETSGTVALTESPDTSNSMLIKRTRSWCENLVSQLAKRESDLRTRYAEADEVYRVAVAKAAKDCEAAKAGIEADLHQVTEVRRALTMAGGELTKAEL